MKLLIVEDEQALREETASYLTERGYLCELAGNYAEAEDKMLLYEYDTIVLDISLPDGDGLQLLRHLKKHRPDAGVLILSAKDSLPDKLEGLNLGADDYITKPFHLEELNARINALIRRKSLSGTPEIKAGEVLIDTAAKTVHVRDEALTLTRKEYELLLYLILNQNRVVSQQAIAEHLWGNSYDMADNFNFIYLHIRNLRKKLRASTGNDHIKTMYGMGYKWESA
ncbi:response regulator transcription factor [Pontibacter mangrovi]|uniref:Response regulator transcription factor n=1 Tax=Pontibacter mangrovi TaxID=2589816 RepID=A0A501W589_9BACT|nr:response regulator transcription factor [Pontibacter mangrovi]TPE44428.1 response regulator transcription factor [Pontibacter mangrovi]